MSTSSMQINVINKLKENGLVGDSTMLAAALRWLNEGYRDMINRPFFDKTLLTKSNFTMTDGQHTYQAPSDFAGFCTMWDVTNGTELIMVTPEELQRQLSTDEVLNESFTSDSDTAVSLDNKAIVQFSEVVTTTDGVTTYIRDTDYSMNYTAGAITVDSTGSMSDATEYYIDYLYMEKGDPAKFCIEYDSTNARFIFRLDPIPDDEYIAAILYPDFPSDLSGSVDSIWSRLEFAIERRGIYYGALEMFESNDPLITRFDKDSEKAIEFLRMRLAKLIPKHNRIKLVMRSSDY